MPFVRVGKTKFLIKQLLILTPLSLSGIFLGTKLVNSVASSSGRQNTSQVAAAPPPTSSATSAARTARRGTPLSGNTNPGDPFGGGNPGGAPSGPTGAVPVDGGLSLLLAAGLGFGAKKAYDYRKSLQEKVES
jgi:hypothetical protein